MGSKESRAELIKAAKDIRERIYLMFLALPAEDQPTAEIFLKTLVDKAAQKAGG